MADAFPGVVASSSRAALTEQLAEEWEALGRLGAELSDDDWSEATPCPGWSVAAQYAHVIGTESMLLGRSNPDVDPGKPDHVLNDIGGFNEVWVAALGRESRAQVLDRLTEVTAARLEALRAMTDEDFAAPSWTPVGKADYRRFMQIRVFDCWVHEQDVRDAVGRPGHQGGPVAEQSIDEIVRALGFVLGKKVGLGADQTVAFRLTGPVERSVDVAVVDGRARTVEPGSSPATVTLTLSSSAFSRLACGRVDPAAELAGVAIAIAGDGDGGGELGRRVVSNLAFTI